MDERNPASQLSEGKKEGGEGGFSIFQPAPPPRLPFNPSLARSKVIGLGTYRSTPPLWFHSPRERESSAMVPTVQPFFLRERERGHRPGTLRSHPRFFQQVISLGPTVRPPRESHRPGALPFHRFFLRERERSSAWTYRSTPLSGLVTQRERVIGHGAYRSTLCKETSSDGQKRNPVFFFFLPAQKHADPFTNKGVSAGRTRRIIPPVPTIRLQGRGKGSGGTTQCLRARTTASYR